VDRRPTAVGAIEVVTLNAWCRQAEGAEVDCPRTSMATGSARYARHNVSNGSTASCEPGFLATARRESIDSRHKGKPVRHPGQASLTQEDDHGDSSSDDQLDAATRAWNKGKLIGQKPPLRPKHVWSIRTRLQMEGGRATWRCSISPLIASCAAAMSSP
jgi:hypothetical protein